MSVAVQYYNGGDMFGNLTVHGTISAFNLYGDINTPNPTTNIRSISSIYSSVSSTDDVLLFDDDSAGSNMTLLLPQTSGQAGSKYITKKIGNSYSVILSSHPPELIDGNESIEMSLQYQSLTLTTDGNNWFII